MKKLIIPCIAILLSLLPVSVVLGCAAPAPAPTPTPQAPVTPTPTPAPVPTTVGINYDDLLVTINSFVNSISMLSKINQSDKNAMSVLRDKLKERNIETGLVSISSELGAPGNLDYCIAVKTNDRDIVFLTVLPADIDPVERLQFVYLEKGQKIGIIPAKLSVSNSYDWYQTYLEETYDYYSYLEYLEEYYNINDKNESRLDEIYDSNEKIRSYIEDPPLMLQYLSDSEYDRVNRELDRLIDLASSRIDRYSDVYLAQFNDQIVDLNNEISIADELSDKYPCEIFYIEEYFINPSHLYPQVQIPLFTPIPLPEYYLITPEVFYTDVDSYLSALSDMINEDDSYNQIPKPDKRQFTFERITDKNFVVTNSKIKW